MLELTVKLSYILIHFISSLIMLLINGTLPTISIYRLYKDTWRFEVWQTHLKSSIQEQDDNYVSDKVKKKIIDDFLLVNRGILIKHDITVNECTSSLYTYLTDRNE